MGLQTVEEVRAFIKKTLTSEADHITSAEFRVFGGALLEYLDHKEKEIAKLRTIVLAVGQDLLTPADAPAAKATTEAPKDKDKEKPPVRSQPFPAGVSPHAPPPGAGVEATTGDGEDDDPPIVQNTSRVVETKPNPTQAVPIKPPMGVNNGAAKDGPKGAA